MSTKLRSIIISTQSFSTKLTFFTYWRISISESCLLLKTLKGDKSCDDKKQSKNIDS